MYTDEDLDTAIDKGIFTSDAVKAFRLQMAREQHTHAVDEENFKLVTSFNDIFVVIACLLLLISAGWATKSMLLVAVLAWGLAEFFVLKRKMALPAIVLLLVFVGSIFSAVINFFPVGTEWAYMIAAALSVVAAYLHWWRFRVPLTIAAGTAGLIAFFIATTLYMVPSAKDWILVIRFVCGVAAFLFAMYWDAADQERVTHRSDVAFWLHLLSAPLIVHPIFSMLGILDGKESLNNMLVVIVLYMLMTFISVVIDRRAFMVSSLIYVLYAFSTLLKAYGMVSYSFALTGICIGVSLLLLSAFWHTVRTKLVGFVPDFLQQYLPH